MGYLKSISNLEIHTCGQCGTRFAMEEDLLDSLRQNQKTFYCPNGHPRVFRETEADRLKKQLASKQAQLDQADARIRDIRAEKEHAERSAATYRGVTTKLKKRISAGTCPCCHRTFGALAAHMQQEHPNFQREVSESK